MELRQEPPQSRRHRHPRFGQAHPWRPMARQSARADQPGQHDIRMGQGPLRAVRSRPLGRATRRRSGY